MTKIEFIELSEWEEKPLSFSQYQTFSQCPEKYHLSKLMRPRPPERPAAWTVHGNAYHKATEMWHLNGGNLLGHYELAWEAELVRQTELQPDLRQWHRTPRTKTTESDLDLRFKAGKVQIEAYKLDANSGEWMIEEHPDDQRPMVETPFEVDIQGKTIRGIVDQIRRYFDDDRREIVDLKTGSPRAGYQQLGLYRTAINELYNWDIIWARFWYSKLDSVPRSGDGLGRYSDYVDLTHLGREYWETQFGAMITSVRAGVRTTSVSDSCERCDVRAWCSAWKEDK